MMVPRAFAANPFAGGSPNKYDEKDEYLYNRRKSSPGQKPQSSSQRSSSPSPLRAQVTRASTTSDKASKNTSGFQTKDTNETASISGTSLAPPSSHSAPKRNASAKDVLASTAIPIRRKPRPRASQRLPAGDHVVGFSKLLLEDVPQAREQVSGSWTNPQFEGLFGNIDGLLEDQMIVGSDMAGTGVMSARSMSTESMTSLISPEDFSYNENPDSTPSMVRSVSDRRIKQAASAEACAEEHPLVHVDHDNEDAPIPTLSISPPQRKPISRHKPSALKSTLSASLKALKIAAQSVSTYATPAAQPEDFGGASFFDFHPSLTDDRRPPPSERPPSPALRRYLNPAISAHPDSPTQLHFWIENRASQGGSSQYGHVPSTEAPQPTLKGKKTAKSGRDQVSRLPRVVPLATCLPSQVRTAHASSPPVWLAPDGTPSNKQTAAAMWEGTEAGLKQCEPRENSDFLRVYVCEMLMKRAKKLREDAEGRAKMWLPPIEREARKSRPAAERLREWSATTV